MNPTGDFPVLSGSENLPGCLGKKSKADNKEPYGVISNTTPAPPAPPCVACRKDCPCRRESS